jgi:hypothetical protein
VDQSKHHITMVFVCKSSGTTWFVTDIYGPAHSRNELITWLADLDSSSMQYWMIMDNFNLIREPDDRNRRGGDTNNMLIFKILIPSHDLEEIPLKGRAYTWSNMLLERLGWFSPHLSGLLNFLTFSCCKTWFLPCAHPSSDWHQCLEV